MKTQLLHCYGQEICFFFLAGNRLLRHYFFLVWLQKQYKDRTDVHLCMTHEYKIPSLGYIAGITKIICWLKDRGFIKREIHDARLTNHYCTVLSLEVNKVFLSSLVRHTSATMKLKFYVKNRIKLIIPK